MRVLRNRTFDEIAIGDSASLERAFSPQDIHMFALQSGDVDPESAVSSSAGHHGGHLCKRPDLGCAGEHGCRGLEPNMSARICASSERFGLVTG